MVGCCRHIAGCLAMLAVTLLSQSSVVVVASEASPSTAPPSAASPLEGQAAAPDPPPLPAASGVAENKADSEGLSSAPSDFGGSDTPISLEAALGGVGQQQKGKGQQQQQRQEGKEQQRQEGIGIDEMDLDDPYAGVDLRDAQRRENVISGGRLKKGEMPKAHLAEEAIAAQINAELGEGSLPVDGVMHPGKEEEGDDSVPKLPQAIANEEPSADVERTPEWLQEKAKTTQDLLEEQKKISEAKKRSEELFDKETERDLERGLVDVTDETVNDAGEEIDEKGEVKKKKVNPFMEGLKGVGNFLVAPFRLGWNLITKGRQTVKVEKEGFKRFFRKVKDAVGKSASKDEKAGQAWSNVALDGWRGITSSPERKEDLLKDIQRNENIQKLMQNQKDTKTIQQIIRETEAVDTPKITRLDDFIKKKHEEEEAASAAQQPK